MAFVESMNQGKRGETQDDSIDAEEFMNASDDDCKLVKVVQAAASGKGSSRKARAKPELSKEEKKEVREANQKELKAAKKCISTLEPVMKLVGKAMRLEHKPDGLESMSNAAKKMLKDAKKMVATVPDATRDFIQVESFGHDAETVAELKKAIEDQSNAAIQLNQVMKGFGSDPSALAALQALQHGSASAQGEPRSKTRPKAAGGPKGPQDVD